MPPKITPADLRHSLWEALTQTSANAKNQAEVGRNQESREGMRFVRNSWKDEAMF